MACECINLLFIGQNWRVHYCVSCSSEIESTALVTGCGKAGFLSSEVVEIS